MTALLSVRATISNDVRVCDDVTIYNDVTITAVTNCNDVATCNKVTNCNKITIWPESRFTGTPALYIECDVRMCHGSCPVSCLH